MCIGLEGRGAEERGGHFLLESLLDISFKSKMLQQYVIEVTRTLTSMKILRESCLTNKEMMEGRRKCSIKSTRTKHF